MKNKGLQLLDQLQIEGKRVFSLEEVRNRLQLSKGGAHSLLGRLRKEKYIATLTSGLYGLVPPSERKHGLVPLPILPSLMQHYQLPYYVGLLSAADYWGAAHHKPQVLQVIVPRQLVLRKAQELRIEFHTKKQFSSQGIVKMKTESGFVAVSSIELTALDLLTYMSSCAGFDNVGLVLQELIPHIKEKELFDILKKYTPVSSAQRLGVFLDFFQASKKIIQHLQKHIQQLQPSTILLLPAGKREGEILVKWNVIINTEMEFEE